MIPRRHLVPEWAPKRPVLVKVIGNTSSSSRCNLSDGARTEDEVSDRRLLLTLAGRAQFRKRDTRSWSRSTRVSLDRSSRHRLKSLAQKLADDLDGRKMEPEGTAATFVGRGEPAGCGARGRPGHSGEIPCIYGCRVGLLRADRV